MMTSQILKCVDFTKTQKSKNLENETLFFLHIKKFTNYTSRATLLQKNSSAAEVTFHDIIDLHMSCLGTLEPEGTCCILCNKVSSLLRYDT